MIAAGRVFVWCNEAVAYEVVPPERCKRSFIIKRSLFQGSFSPLRQTFNLADFLKSVIAILVYAASMPFAAILGHHRFMILTVKLAYHSGKVLAALGVKPINTPYVTS